MQLTGAKRVCKLKLSSIAPSHEGAIVFAWP